MANLFLNNNLIKATSTGLGIKINPAHPLHVSGTTQIAGGIINRQVKKSSNYTTTDTDYIVGFQTTTASGIITLGSATVKSGRTVIINDVDGNASNNFITIATEGAETIDGDSTEQIILDYDSRELYSDGNNWFII